MSHASRSAPSAGDPHTLHQRPRLATGTRRRKRFQVVALQRVVVKRQHRRAAGHRLPHRQVSGNKGEAGAEQKARRVLHSPVHPERQPRRSRHSPHLRAQAAITADIQGKLQAVRLPGKGQQAQVIEDACVRLQAADEDGARFWLLRGRGRRQIDAAIGDRVAGSAVPARDEAAGTERPGAGAAHPAAHPERLAGDRPPLVAVEGDVRPRQAKERPQRRVPVEERVGVVAVDHVGAAQQRAVLPEQGHRRPDAPLQAHDRKRAELRGGRRPRLQSRHHGYPMAEGSEFLAHAPHVPLHPAPPRVESRGQHHDAHRSPYRDPRRSTRPGSAPVCLPSRTTATPLTKTWRIPSG